MLSQPGLFNAPSPAGAPLPQTNYIQPNLGHGLRIWWAYYWPTTLISLLIVVVLTVLLRTAWENVIISGHVVLWADRILPYVVFYAVSVFTIRYILGKNFRSFSIALLSRDESSGVGPLPRSLRRTLRVWWAYCWRAVVYALIAMTAANLALGIMVEVLATVGPVMARLVPFISGVAINCAVGLFVIYSAILDEDFGDFRVTLVPRAAAPQAASAVEHAAPDSIPQ